LIQGHPLKLQTEAILEISQARTLALTLQALYQKSKT